MNNTNRNPSFKPTQHEIDSVSKRARRDALKGGLAGGLAGALVGRKYKAKLVGAGLGATAGDMIGRRVGRREGARDVVESRKALLQNNLAELQELVTQLTARAEQRDFDREGNDFPSAFPQPKMPMRKSVRGMRSVTGNGVSAEAEFFQLREDLTAHYGWAITSALSDEDLSAENCERLRNQVLGRQSKAAGPHASTQNDPEFERHFLASKIGEKAVSEMPDTLVHCNFLAAVRRGDLVEFGYSPDATDFAIINRERNGEGQFVDNDLVSSQAIQRAYHPRDRRTGVETGGAGLAAGAAGLGALALLKGRKARRPRLPMGVPRLPAGSVDANATAFGMGTPSSYIIRRATLRGKKPPGVPKVKIAGKKKTNLAFLIHDDAFPLVPQPGQKLAPGMRQRVKPARTRKDVLARLKEITQLASRHDLGLGAAVAEGAIDALGIGEATTPKKRRLLRDANGNILNPQFLKDPGTTSTSSFASALRRLHEFGIGDAVTRGAARFAPEVAAIGIGDVLGETAHDRIKAAQDKKKRRLMRQRGGVEQNTATPGNGPTALSSVHDTLLEFDRGNERMKRDAAAAGVGAGIGGYGALATYKPGRPAHPGEDLQGKRVFVKRKSAIPSYHVGVGGEDGVVHRSPGRGDFREVKRDTFRRNGAGGLRVEDVLNGKTPRANARAASKAAGTKAGKYGIGQNNCEHGVDRILGGRGASHQVRRGVAGLVGGAVVGGTMAEILNRKSRKDQ